MSNVEMNKEILDVVNAVINYGRFIISNNYIIPTENFDHIKKMEEYYKSLPLPEGMNKNNSDFERILDLGWYSNKELESLNNTNYSDLHYTSWK